MEQWPPWDTSLLGLPPKIRTVMQRFSHQPIMIVNIHFLFHCAPVCGGQSNADQPLYSGPWHNRKTGSTMRATEKEATRITRHLKIDDMLAAQTYRYMLADG